LLIGAEKVRTIRLVYQLEPISPRINILIRDKTIANNIEVSFDLGLLQKSDTLRVNTTGVIQYNATRTDALPLLSQYKCGPLSTK
jgi:hypothetical protein